jgi:hypothetical protein
MKEHMPSAMGPMQLTRLDVLRTGVMMVKTGHLLQGQTCLRRRFQFCFHTVEEVLKLTVQLMWNSWTMYDGLCDIMIVDFANMTLFALLLLGYTSDVKL